ncbi:Mrp/NBP35 family ATP-binding protein [Alicyclobacillus kakegawensis]|uniref:Mrp/NBP35 family ATP-binding protein n=1 Tax=Alicyclobacillus kakegawensis TaxID=392012 RepID=UPI0008371C7C|nr:Mrp/NBP35 family ATP-binding protein [Alicyclobacillus kakegawensis]
MVDAQSIRDALRDVEDPEIHKSIVELEMVRRIDIQGSHVSVEIALTIGGCPLQTTIEQAVREKLLALEGIESVEVKLGTMTDEERAAFAAKLRGPQAGEQKMPALLKPDAGVEFIAVASGKGGVGKSTVTANVARALAAAGLKVGVIDADIYGFSLPRIFGVQGQRPTVIDDLIIPIEVDGVKIMSMDFFVPANNPVVWRGPMLGKMLRNFFAEVHWGEIEVMLLDLPPGTGDVALDVHQLLPKSKEILVTTPQADAAAVAVRAGLMAVRTQHEVIGIVENMAWYECPGCGERTYLFGRGGGEQVASEVRSQVLAQVPIAALEPGESSLFAPDSPQGRAYMECAQKILARLSLRGRNAIAR